MLQKIIGIVLVIEEWSSSFSLKARMFVLSRLALRKVNGIIRTDAVGCGIDIDDIDVVISSTCRATSTRKLAGPGEQIVPETGNLHHDADRLGAKEVPVDPGRGWQAAARADRNPFERRRGIRRAVLGGAE
ncbi:uncharacterized protein LOC120412565 [Culex pipiens pallens]|uniref:uncharacterized protein LOC120412565 n=1 Tax=Culex pipiens pallens TaxID=42434 RepID=UPI001953A6EB|nr:uncharacterized protein LOC120412565 [Culex pipiens pallens]